MRAIGQRLQKTREALGVTAEAAAHVAGVTRSAWSNYEAGARPPPALAIQRFCLRFGISTDWILLGNPSTLPAGLAEKLETIWRHAS